MTTFGFFSLVQKPGEYDLTVRARVRRDLDALRERLPALGPTVSGAGTDYPYRATVPHAQLAQLLAQVVNELDYANFKNAVALSAGKERAHAYSDVWRALLRLEHLDED